MGPQELLTAHDVAEILGIDRTTVARRRRAGALPAVMKASGSRGPYLYSREEIERLAAEEAAK